MPPYERSRSLSPHVYRDPPPYPGNSTSHPATGGIPHSHSMPSSPQLHHRPRLAAANRSWSQPESAQLPVDIAYYSHHVGQPQQSSLKNEPSQHVKVVNFVDAKCGNDIEAKQQSVQEVVASGIAQTSPAYEKQYRHVPSCHGDGPAGSREEGGPALSSVGKVRRKSLQESKQQSIVPVGFSF